MKDLGKKTLIVFLLSWITFIIIFLALNAPAAEAGLVSDVSDFFTNTFTSYEAYTEFNTRIKAPDNIDLDGCSGYIPLEIENLESYDRDYNIGLNFVGDKCQVNFYLNFRV